METICVWRLFVYGTYFCKRKIKFKWDKTKLVSHLGEQKHEEEEEKRRREEVEEEEEEEEEMYGDYLCMEPIFVWMAMILYG